MHSNCLENDTHLLENPEFDDLIYTELEESDELSV